tara:strand:- start:769 stop:1065 length:297 start_codon:yes stop_codon:yes gene_type:complete
MSAASSTENQALANAFAAIASKSEAKLLAEQRIQNQNKNQIGQKSSTEIESESLAATKAEVMAKWGFLKNIVNIDRFFASGAGGDDKKEEKKDDAKLA